MPDDWLDVVLRFALYLDLMILFGTPLFSLYALRAGGDAPAFLRLRGGAAVATASAGIVLSGWSLLETAQSMTGAATYAALTSQAIGMILTATAVGTAWMVRMAALAAWLIVAAACRQDSMRRCVALAASGAVALTTLAWAGHGAMDDGGRGAFHLIVDVAHLLAAGMWVGALVGFAQLSSRRWAIAPGHVRLLSGAASGFAAVGTGIVVTLAVTGVINYGLVAGPMLDALYATPYGRLLVAKLMLFAAMLGLAAVNRYRLSPRLAAAIRAGDDARAVAALRSSVRTEATLAVLILALVAWLGTQSPLPS